jgi:hypothetical protein
VNGITLLGKGPQGIFEISSDAMPYQAEKGGQE